jgi:hypothetical protein
MNHCAEGGVHIALCVAALRTRKVLLLETHRTEHVSIWCCGLAVAFTLRVTVVSGEHVAEAVAWTNHLHMLTKQTNGLHVCCIVVICQIEQGLHRIHNIRTWHSSAAKIYAADCTTQQSADCACCHHLR